MSASHHQTNDEEKWHNAVRPVATLFVNLGLHDAMLFRAASDDATLAEVLPHSAARTCWRARVSGAFVHNGAAIGGLFQA